MDIEISVQELLGHFEVLVEAVASVAISGTETYQEALNLIERNAGLTVFGQEVKKAVQGEIKKRALGSKCKE